MISFYEWRYSYAELASNYEFGDFKKFAHIVLQLKKFAEGHQEVKLNDEWMLKAMRMKLMLTCTAQFNQLDSTFNFTSMDDCAEVIFRFPHIKDSDLINHGRQDVWKPVNDEDGSTYYDHLAGFIHKTVSTKAACQFYMQQKAGSLLFGEESNDPEKRLNAWKLFKDAVILKAQEIDDRTEWFDEDFIPTPVEQYDASLPRL